MQLLDVLVQRGHVNLAELFNYFAFVSFLLVHLHPSLTLSIQIRYHGRHRVSVEGVPFREIAHHNWATLRLGGGTDMIGGDDSEGLWHLLEGGMR